MRWLGRIGILLLVLALGVVAWVAIGSDAPNGAARPAVGDARPADAPTDTSTDTGDDGLPARRHVVTADSGGARSDDAAPRGPRAMTGIILEYVYDGVLPVSGATVRLYVDSNDLSDAPNALTTTVVAPADTASTGADGRFSFDVAPGAPWRLWITTDDGRATHARGVGPEDAGDLYLYDLERCRITVTDEQDRPLPDAQAYLYSSTFDTIPFGAARAGADGAIVLDPAPGSVAVTAPGHGFTEVDNPKGDVRVSLPLGVDLAGVVVDDTGAPLVGVQLSIDDAGPERTLSTDADGRFRFERVGAQDEVWMSVHLEDLAVPRVLAYGDLDARVVIPRRGDVAGIAVFEDGSPAEGAQVENKTTDKDGRFVLWTDGRDQAFTVVGHVWGHVEGFGGKALTHVGSHRVELRPGETTDVRLVLSESPYSFVSARAISPEGDALRSVTVHVAGEWCASQHVADRTLTLVSVPPGSQVTVQIGDTANRFSPVALTALTTAAWDAPPIEARLGAVEPVMLRAFAPDGAEIPRGEWTRVHVHGGELLPNGRIRAQTGASVRIVLEAQERRFDRRVNLPTEAPYEVQIRFPKTVRVRGRLLRGDGRAARHLDIVVAPYADMGSGTYLRTTPAADGSFVIDDVPSGRALFVVWQNDGEVQAQRGVIEVPETGELDLGEMLAWDDIMLEGRVGVPRGDSAGGLSVDVYWDEGRENAHALTGTDGSFRIRVPGVPNALVTAGRRGRLFGLQPIDLSQTRRADLRATRVGRVRVHVSESWRERGFDVYVVTPDGNHAWAPDSDWIDGGRTVIAEDVPSGTWLLRVVHAETVMERTIQVTPGEETIVHFDR